MAAEEHCPVPGAQLSRRSLFAAGAAATTVAHPALAAAQERGADFESWERERDRLFKLSNAVEDDELADAPFREAWRYQDLLLGTPCSTRREACAKLRAVFHPEIGAQNWGDPDRELAAVRQVLTFLEAN